MTGVRPRIDTGACWRGWASSTPSALVEPGISASITSESSNLCVAMATISDARSRSEEHTSELQSLMRISYAVFCLKKKKIKTITNHNITKERQNKTASQITTSNEYTTHT